MQFNSKIMSLYTAENGVAFLRYKRLEELECINHAFSTRLGGVSSGEFTSMNLSFGRGDSDENVTENYRRFCAAAGFNYNELVASAQDHHTFVRRVSRKDCGIGIYKPRDIASVDALITNDPEVTLVTYYADCTPLFFVDVKNKAIGLAHSGWRGTVARIGKCIIEKMQADFGTKPSELICAVGPAISKCCYEVSRPVAEEFIAAGFNADKILTEKADGKFMLDLLCANKEILIECGVPSESIAVSDLCTQCSSDLLWSHRATGGKRGTMSAFMRLKP